MFVQTTFCTSRTKKMYQLFLAIGCFSPWPNPNQLRKRAAKLMSHFEVLGIMPARSSSVNSSLNIQLSAHCFSYYNVFFWTLSTWVTEIQNPENHGAEHRNNTEKEERGVRSFMLTSGWMWVYGRVRYDYMCAKQTGTRCKWLHSLRLNRLA